MDDLVGAKAGDDILQLGIGALQRLGLGLVMRVDDLFDRLPWGARRGLR